MKQELNAILSFGAQAVSNTKNVFDEAAGVSLDRLIQGNSNYKSTSVNPAKLTSELRENTAILRWPSWYAAAIPECRWSISSTLVSESYSSSEMLAI